MKTKIYKIELSVIALNGLSREGLIAALENCKYVYPSIMSIEEREIDWTDDHPLNKTSTAKETFEELFSDEGDVSQAEYNRALDHEVDFD